MSVLEDFKKSTWESFKSDIEDGMIQSIGRHGEINDEMPPEQVEDWIMKAKSFKDLYEVLEWADVFHAVGILEMYEALLIKYGWLDELAAMDDPSYKDPETAERLNQLISRKDAIPPDAMDRAGGIFNV